MSGEQLLPIETIVGVQPQSDKTQSSTRHYTDAQWVRFKNGSPEKIGGFEGVLIANNKQILGVGRTIYSEFINGKYYTIIGTNSRLYALIGSELIELLDENDLVEGSVDENAAQGYGAGRYGVGLYGTAKVSQFGRAFPRIWFVSRYGATFILTAGNQTGIYTWDGSTFDIPLTKLENAPDSVNYAFVSDNTIVTLGADNVENRIFTSNQNDITNWTATFENVVYDDDIEGSSRLISHTPLINGNLIFSNQSTYSFTRKTGSRLIWDFKVVENSIGIIAPLARITISGIAYWMGTDNFYYYNGGRVQIIPSNSGRESTVLRYVFDNLNYAQKSKCFVWHNKEFNEIWFHYPSAVSNEPDRAAVVNLGDFSWYFVKLNRTGAESPAVKRKKPFLIASDKIYRHETGNNADGQPILWSITTDRRTIDKYSPLNMAFIPDSRQSGNISVKLQGYQYPQSANTTYDNNYDVLPDTERVATNFKGRFWQYTISGNALNQFWRMGQWYEEKRKGSEYN